jgi:autoinducer 2-degrading protein
MFTVIVSLQVRPDRITEFVQAIRSNSLASVATERGCLRFDVHRSHEDPHRFILVEIYEDKAAFEQEHRRAPHYAAWQEVAARCLEPGGHANTFASPVFPDDVVASTVPKVPGR